MKVLITGFTPFDGEAINPAYEAVKNLEDMINGAQIIKREISTVFHKSIEELDNLMGKENPDIVICVGQAGGRVDISIERIGINIDDARIPDNEGNQLIDEKIYQDGENAYFSSLPIKAMVARIREEGIPASISNTAGTFVCNHLMYGLLYLSHNKYPSIRGGFIHVPYSTEQVITKGNVASMSIEDITKGLGFAIEAALDYKVDIKTVEGKTH